MKASFLAPLAIFAQSSLRTPLNLGSLAPITPEVILSSQHICDYDNIVVAGFPGLTFDDLYAIPSSSFVAQQYSQATLKTLGQNTFEDNRIANMIAQKCSLPIATGDDLPYPGGVSTFTFMDVEHGTVTRKDAVSQSLAQLSQVISQLKTDSSTVVIIQGLPPNRILDPVQHTKRSSPDSHSPFFHQGQQRSSNSTIVHGGLLHRYQLLTPNLLLATLVSLLILFPIIWFGVSALSSIQIPTNMGDIAKSEKRS